ncbi:hypothetical protein BU202_02035 [Streptococcus cuniculi]|uniref:Uncharacterized protein n=1 Tax=Streptococcus cuniculi TaxID=1432788 RepID=A0A1Q8E9G2_9STRE|nr:hypothetical protein [Streptococcus cuniculi]OLF48418.1 hypothetical protein BU202_02035 [Streptococcus cuniculi]
MEFKEQIQELQKQLPPQRQLIVGNAPIPYAKGFYFDGTLNKWCIYENGERGGAPGNQLILWEADTEEEIMELFIESVKSEIKRYQKYLNWVNNSKK